MQTDPLAHVWHPCSQMKDYEIFKPLMVQAAQGCFIQLEDGRKIIDAISSWWCKSLGHQHPRLKRALLQQLEKFEHVLLANTTNEIIIRLSAKLAGLTQQLKKVFYASDGSSAVEIALKMSLHAREIRGEHKKTKFLALKNSFHGETLGALSVSDVGYFRKPYESLLFEVHFIEPPYVLSATDPTWFDCSSHWIKTERWLEAHIDTTTALIVEPIVQGVGGMKIYSADFLRRLRQWSQVHGIHLIADEIMTGLGRTGKMLACEYAGIEPDFICLSKGLTGGYLPFSAVLISSAIYELFYDDYASGKTFIHSHTFSGHVLAAAVACELLDILKTESVCEKAIQLGELMLQNMQEVAANTGQLHNIRQLGAIVAADLIEVAGIKRRGFVLSQQAIQRGALLRPLGNTVYWLPPLNTGSDVITKLKEITQESIMAAC
jgi:adenosylmethionine---8-amino-7-oxononanoate aminotransferase